MPKKAAMKIFGAIELLGQILAIKENHSRKIISTEYILSDICLHMKSIRDFCRTFSDYFVLFLQLSKILLTKSKN